MVGVVVRGNSGGERRHGVGIGDIAHVCRNAHTARAVGGHLCRARQFFGVQIASGDMAAGSSELANQLTPHSCAAAGDHRYASCEFSDRHAPIPLW